MSLAFQLWMSRCFMAIRKEEFIEAAAEVFHAQIAFDASIVTDRDLTGFLRDHDADGVGFFGEAKSGAVAQPQITVQILALAERKNAGRRYDAVVAYNQPTIMQDGLGMEDGEDEFRGVVAVDIHSGLGELAEIDVAFQGDKRAEAFAGELEDGIDQLFHRFVVAGGGSEPPVGAQFGECPAQFRLENHDESDGQEAEEAAQHPADDNQVQQLADEGEGEENECQPDEDARSMRAAEIKVNIIENHRDEKNLHRRAPV